MKPLSILQRVLILFGIVLGVLMFSQPTPAHAEQSLLEKYHKQVPFMTPASKLPKEIAKHLKHPIPDNAKGQPNYGAVGYPIGQCTWYAYGRAKTNGRKYQTMEGDGGYWKDNVSNYGVTTHTTGGTKPIPQTAISVDRRYSDLWHEQQFTTHVQYAEYIDSKGYLLLSESNLDGGSGKVYIHILTPDQAQHHGMHYVKPLNYKKLSDWNKNPDGGTGSSSGSSSKNKSDTSNDDADQGTEGSTAKLDLAPADDTFTVNGYGSNQQKDWKEIALADKLPKASDLESLTSSQKQNLADWTADYSTTNDATILKTIRTGIVFAGFLVVLYALMLIVAYAIDRIGILDLSTVGMVTNGRYLTTYTPEEKIDMDNSNTGTKGFNMKTLIITVLVAMALFTLIITGKLFYLSYDLYINLSTFMNWVNTIRPQ